jgi:serine phosphatase RsbU (regulator of sigma subunit)
VLWLDTGEELSGGRGPPLGISEEHACTTSAHQLTPGTGVLLYTDGVTEARHNGDQFGQTRLAQIVQSFKGQAPPRWSRRSHQRSTSLPPPAWPTAVIEHDDLIRVAHRREAYQG